MHEESPLRGTVRIIFQPAEETMPGGAQSCIEQGVLEGVPRILALHCDPRIEMGKIGTRIGAITSASDTIKIELTGRGGHTSRPHLTEELVFALAQIAVNVPAVLSRRVDVRSGVSVVWGHISAGSAPNAIPASGYMAGTMRCLDRDAWHSAGEILDEVIQQIAAPYGVDVHLEHTRGVPPVVELRARDRADRSRGPRRDRRGRRGPDPAVHGRRGLRLVPRGPPGAMMRLGTKTPAARSTTSTAATTSWTNGRWAWASRCSRRRPCAPSATSSPFRPAPAARGSAVRRARFPHLCRHDAGTRRRCGRTRRRCLRTWGNSAGAAALAPLQVAGRGFGWAIRLCTI